MCWHHANNASGNLDIMFTTMRIVQSCSMILKIILQFRSFANVTLNKGRRQTKVPSIGMRIDTINKRLGLIRKQHIIIPEMVMMTITGMKRTDKGMQMYHPAHVRAISNQNQIHHALKTSVTNRKKHPSELF